MVLAQSTSELAAYVKPCTEGVRMTTWGHLSVKIIVIIHHRQITSRSWSFLWDSIYSPLLLEVVWAYCTLPSFIFSSNLGMNRFVPSDIAQTATTLVFVQLVCARPVAAIFGWLGKAFPWWTFWLAPQLAAWNWILGPTCHQDACHTFILHYIIAFMLLIFYVIVLFNCELRISVNFPKFYV